MKYIAFLSISFLTVANIHCFNFQKFNYLDLINQHPTILNYDDNECSHSTVDEEDLSRFSLEQNNFQYHFPHSNSGESTIKYYINATSLHDSTLTWYYNMPASYIGDQVKQNFINSILKWNNIYFYEYLSTNLLTKRKIVNIIEGTLDDHNVLIHPEKASYMYYNNSAAETKPTGSPLFDQTENSVRHAHYTNRDIALNLESIGINTTNNNYYLNRYGAHEFGHVLGLKDIDTVEGTGNHHFNLLMGYGTPTGKEITYKDLVGAAITRGYHKDIDHVWMCDFNSSTSNNYKLICSICNSVRYTNSLTNINYVTYKACNNMHELIDGNMFAVASYENKDYYKCRYCKYVEDFADIIPQNYNSLSYDSYQHFTTNQVNGLNYSFYESHSFNYSYTWANYTKHYANCSCGENQLKGHVISANSINAIGPYSTCLQCGGLASIGFVWPTSSSDYPHTENGSFILPNGIIVLNEKDIESYFNNTLNLNDFDSI